MLFSQKIMIHFIGLLSILLIMNQGSSVPTIGPHEFSFQLTSGDTKSTKDYNDKPILIEWAASWCGVCKANQKNINTIYNDYKANVNFISISYGGSGDDLDKVKKMKSDRGYSWDFALDINNYAGDNGASNGDTWILFANLTVFKSWDYTVVSTADLKGNLNLIIDNISVDTASSSNTGDTSQEAIEDLGLFDNPLFYGFIGISVIAVIVILISKFKSQ